MKKKLVFIVGGNGSIGTEISKKFIKLKNYQIIILDIKSNKNLNSNIHQVYFDLSKLKNIRNNIKKIIKKFGCPDIFINASYPITSKWKNINYDNLDYISLSKNIEIHLNSFALSANEVAKHMAKRKVKGSIIILNSIYGILGQDNNLYKNTNIKPNPIYSLIKGGLVNFVKGLAAYYGKDQIRVNSIIAGGIKGNIAGSKVKQNQNFKKKYNLKTPLGRMARADEIASPVIFLATDEASYVTGANYFVDGGFSII